MPTLEKPKTWGKHQWLAALRDAFPQTAEREELLTGDDQFRPISDWPAFAMTLALQPRCGDDDRLSLTKFFLVNGARPIFVMRWFLSQPGFLDNQKSVLKIIDIIKRHQRGELARYNAWNMDFQALMPVETPSDALDDMPQRVVIHAPSWQWKPLLPELKYVDGCPLGTWEQVGLEPKVIYMPPPSAEWTDAIRMAENRMHQYPKQQSPKLPLPPNVARKLR
tara:strand:+ start:1678 stop:2343 length:666 start_codon:yes stop_codon:yes gene_type:complete